MDITGEKFIGQNNVVDSIKRVAMRGALWVSITSAIAIPLAYYRNWILGRMGLEGEVVGTYAMIMIFFRIITTFVLFGGLTVVTNYLPKITRREDKASFLITYGAISAVAVTAFLLLILIWPELLRLLIRKPVDRPTLMSVAVLTPIIVLSQITIYSLAGLMNFRVSSVLNQVQIFLVSALGTAAFFFFRDFLAQRALVIVTATVCLAHVLVIFLGGYSVIKSIGRPVWQLHLPSGFWRFSSFVHINTICTFVYLCVDQIFVLAALGVRELGAYFVMLQCAQMIRFVPERIGQVMLASFSHLVGTGEHDRLKWGYIKLCRLNLILCTFLALGLILFSRQIGAVFGEWYESRHLYLILLAVVINIGNLGNINSMLIMAKERTGYFMINSLVQIGVQLVLTALLITKLEVYGVIIGKSVGLISAQIGLFLIVRWGLSRINLAPPKAYWISQVMVTGTACAAWHIDGQHLVWAIAVMTALFGSFLLVIRFHPREIMSLLPSRAKQALERSVLD